MKKPNLSKKFLSSAKRKLHHARNTLKLEFAGIDEIIDEIINLIEPWYVLGNTNGRPTVVALWGMTGVGKTHLVSRLAALLDYEDSYARFDMGEVAGSTNNFWFKYQLFDELEDLNGQKGIICVDEMQLGRTVYPGGMEADKDNTRPLWELIDSGIINPNERLGSNYSDILKLDHLLKLCIKKGVKAEFGFVTKKVELYKKIVEGMSYDEYPTIGSDDEPVRFVPDEFYSDILTVDENNFKSEFEMMGYLYSLNEKQTYEYIHSLLKKSRSPKRIDLSNALVFLLGNLDELYPYANLTSPDMNADQYYEETKRITIPQVKEALQMRFRNEQIARIGNNHIIYPSLNKSAYNTILSKQLSNVSHYFMDKYDLKLSFHSSVKKLIYEEGVYPMQGARPLLSSIKSLIDVYSAKVLNHVLLKFPETSQINWFYEHHSYRVQLLDKNHSVLTELNFKVSTKSSISKLATSNAQKAVIAIHESGHALVATVLTKVLPIEIKIALANYGNKGYMVHVLPEGMHSRKSLCDKIAISLAGICAEELIFGKQNVSIGAKADIQNATAIASNMVKELGLGSELNFVTVPSIQTSDTIFTSDLHEAEIKKIIKEQRKVVFNILEQEKTSLLKLAEQLIISNNLTKDMISTTLMKHTSTEWMSKGKFIVADDYFDHDYILKKELSELNINN